MIEPDEEQIRQLFKAARQFEESQAPGFQATIAGARRRVERETGSLGLFAQGQLQIAPRQMTDELLRIDASELPEWATDRPAGVPALSFRYLRPGWRLTLEVATVLALVAYIGWTIAILWGGK